MYILSNKCKLILTTFEVEKHFYEALDIMVLMDVIVLQYFKICAKGSSSVYSELQI